MAAQQEIRLRLGRGLDVAFAGKPRQALHAAATVRSAAVSGHDFPGVRPDLKVEVGARVDAGQTLFTDRRRPEIAIAAPVSGTVAAIERGRRRSLDQIVIDIDGDEAEDFSAARGDTRAVLLKSGLWPSFLTRPFGRIPDPDAVPDAIFVTAIDTWPLAPDPRVAIGLDGEEFERGVEALLGLGPGPVFVCQGPGALICGGLDPRVRPAVFEGKHPAGLAGTHIHLLAPAGNGRTVWSIGYQDVIAIGRLLMIGRSDAARIVSIAGEGVREPALARLPQGASLDDALDGRLAEGPVRVVSGPVLAGRESGYLGRYHNQVTAIPEANAPDGLISRLLSRLEAGPGDAIIPGERLEAAMALDILPVPLMRALAVGDVEAARELGCLELVEDDVALLSRICMSGADYGALLRDVLDQIAEEG